QQKKPILAARVNGVTIPRGQHRSIRVSSVFNPWPDSRPANASLLHFYRGTRPWTKHGMNSDLQTEALLLFRDPQLFELLEDVFAVAFGSYFLVDELHDAFFVDVERPAFRKIPPLVNHAVGLRRSLFGIAENRIIELQRFREFLVRLCVVATGG